jgi:hypothetical protein
MAAITPGASPKVAAAITALPTATLILDGEIVIFDEHLISRFEWLRHRDREALAIPPIYIAFDVLQVDGRDVRHLPLRDRRKVLEDLLADRRVLLPARRLAQNGLEAWQEVERGRLRGPRRQGRRLAVRRRAHPVLLSRSSPAAAPNFAIDVMPQGAPGQPRAGSYWPNHLALTYSPPCPAPRPAAGVDTTGGLAAQPGS